MSTTSTTDDLSILTPQTINKSNGLPRSGFVQHVAIWNLPKKPHGQVIFPREVG